MYKVFIVKIHNNSHNNIFIFFKSKLYKKKYQHFVAKYFIYVLYQIDLQT